MKRKKERINWLALIKQANKQDDFEIYCFIHGRTTIHQKGISLNRCARAFCVKNKLIKNSSKDFSSLDKVVKEFNKAYGFVE